MFKAERCWNLRRAPIYKKGVRGVQQVVDYGWRAVEYVRSPRPDDSSLFVWMRGSNISKVIRTGVGCLEAANQDGLFTELSFVKTARHKRPALRIEDYVDPAMLAEWRLGATLYLRIVMNVKPWVNREPMLRTLLITRRYKSRKPWEIISDLGVWPDPTLVADSLGVRYAWTHNSLDAPLLSVVTLGKRPSRISAEERIRILKKEKLEARHGYPNRTDGAKDGT